MVVEKSGTHSQGKLCTHLQIVCHVLRLGVGDLSKKATPLAFEV